MRIMEEKREKCEWQKRSEVRYIHFILPPLRRPIRSLRSIIIYQMNILNILFELRYRLRKSRCVSWAWHPYCFPTIFAWSQVTSCKVNLENQWWFWEKMSESCWQNKYWRCKERNTCILRKIPYEETTMRKNFPSGMRSPAKSAPAGCSCIGHSGKKPASPDMRCMR